MVRKPGKRKPEVLDSPDTLPVQEPRVRGMPSDPPVQPLSGQCPLCPRCKHESDSSVDFCSRCGFSFRATCSVTEHEAVHGALVGQLINKKYRILSILGEGGPGVVFKAELLHPALSKDQNFRRRFLREVGIEVYEVGDAPGSLPAEGAVPTYALTHQAFHRAGRTRQFRYRTLDRHQRESTRFHNVDFV